MNKQRRTVWKRTAYGCHSWISPFSLWYHKISQENPIGNLTEALQLPQLLCLLFYSCPVTHRVTSKRDLKVGKVCVRLLLHAISWCSFRVFTFSGFHLLICHPTTQSESQNEAQVGYPSSAQVTSLSLPQPTPKKLSFVRKTCDDHFLDANPHSNQRHGISSHLLLPSQLTLLSGRMFMQKKEESALPDIGTGLSHS